MMSDPIGETIHSPDHLPKAAPTDKRQAPRFSHRDVRATLSWHDGPKHITVEAVVIDLSGGGSALLVAQTPAEDHTVWLQLECGSDKLEPWQGRTLGKAVDASGKKLVRLKFTSWIPLGTILELHREPGLSQRHAACETRATLSWIESNAQRRIPGKLLNLSGLDAAIKVDADIPSDKTILFGLECDAPAIDPIKSRLIFSTSDPSGSKIVRIQFVDHCPKELFEFAVHGRR